MLFFEKLYFELAMKEREEYKEKLNDKIKSQIDEYYNDKNVKLITKDELSMTIIRFLLNVEMNQKNDIIGLIEINDNLFNYLNKRFIKESEPLDKLDIYVRNSYDFYQYISGDINIKFEDDRKKLLERIKNEEEEKLLKQEMKNKNEIEKKDE